VKKYTLYNLKLKFKHSDSRICNFHSDLEHAFRIMDPKI